jgi:FlaA1/EpsC-like NDP-sugar epimerase
MEPGAVPSATRHWTSAQACADWAAWALALLGGLIARYDFKVPWQRSATALIICVAVALIVQTVVGRVTHLYLGRYRLASFDEVAGVATSVSITAVVTLMVDLVVSNIGDVQRLPISVPVAAAFGALVLMTASRYLRRVRAERGKRASAGGEPLVVFGAGEGAAQVLRSMIYDPTSKYVPVALLDDDPAKQHLRISGIRVQGRREQIAAVAAETGAKNLLIAIPSADATLLRELTSLAEAEKLHVKVLPPVSEFLDRVGVDDIRDIDLADLLGRRQIETDIDSVAGYVTGRRVLVTGAGGSIGSELCRQIFRFEPAELMMLDRDESALHSVQLSIYGRALLDSEDLILADIRDADAIESIFLQRRPEVVFHAAALKHLTLLERHPAESIKTNVRGTATVLNASQTAGVVRFINISTDKAANPSSVLGYSKLITERLTAGAALDAQRGRYISVRFGNVLGSRGSVLTAFSAQVAAGGPITVTDPHVTRYFMTVQEAVQLVIQAGAIGQSGETLVLDMGSPVRIADVARRLAVQSPRNIDIVYTGLRPGEKLHEDLFGADEDDVRPVHPLISHVSVARLDDNRLRDLDLRAAPQSITASLRSVAITPLPAASAASVDALGRP